MQIDFAWFLSMWLLVYHGDDGTIWIECDKIESITI